MTLHRRRRRRLSPGLDGGREGGLLLSLRCVGRQ